ncbi:TIGR00159 family protein [Gloeocapsopsis crepidinum LEGE 06123]|uniref:Diadenylate cyclase n=1 Tax=Gloeocapsopsis crepidinum LEGE 06123 TaxID=588587 RepID=A0ABR9USS0_9CHRO|nr:diadenylate cyclase CdaA [Gloeocapsopsis crepidinum]MBE9191332.1 TIGR00159 family protein [Gloeocapsopsis crepidinum LEGE 06123]
MRDLWKQWLIDLGWTQSVLLHIIDLGLVLGLTYMVLVIIGERRTLWMVRGFIVLMLASVVSGRLELRLLNFVLEKLVIGCAVAIAVAYQSDLRRFLEQLGRGELGHLWQPSRRTISKPDSVIDEIVEAVKELSQNRIGALIVLETNGPIDEGDFNSSGVQLNAEVSKELIQTIFHPKTPLHDGAALIRGSRLVAAAVILPLTKRTASRQLGTRHRAAMGITERVPDNSICVVVSEETGSISFAEKGVLNRPLTSSKLKELLEAKFSPPVERETVAPSVLSWVRQVSHQGKALVSRLLGVSSSASHRNKK